MNRESVAELLRQLIEGMDFDPPHKLVKINAATACQIPTLSPYSIATNVWHCDFWNRIWLARIEGHPAVADNVYKEDWHQPTPSEWEATRESFLANLTKAHEIAKAKDFEYATKTEEEAVRRLCQLAVHSAYHVGQIALLKRLARAEKKAAKEESS